MSDRRKDGTLMEISVKQLYPSEYNCFCVEMDEAMEELIASVRLKGILSPILARKVDDAKYEILSGHRRHFAAAKAGLNNVPVIVLEASDEDRDIIIADSNLQRPYIKISEKAWAIRLKYDALRKQNNERSGESNERDPGSYGIRSTEIVAKKMGIGEKTVQRYMRLTYLEPCLLYMVDEGKIPLKAGVQLSYLSQRVQKYIFDVLDIENIKINEDTAGILREELSEDATMEDVFSLLKCESMNKSKKMKLEIRISKNMKKTYFPEGYDDFQVNEIIVNLLKSWSGNFK